MSPLFLRPVALGTATLTLALAGCTTTTDSFLSSRVDYRAAAATPAPTLQVPPDLTQLSGDPRYQPPVGGSVSATALQSAATEAGAKSPSAATATAVAPQSSGELRIERSGQQRWLVTRQTPEQLWPVLRQFWQDSGFALASDLPQAGVMETDWAENRARLPDDLVSRTVGKVLDRLRDTGERDRYRTRVERNGEFTEIYISHRGLEEIATGPKERTETLRWVARPSDAGLEAEMLARLMVRLGSPDENAKPSAQAVDGALKTVTAVPAATQRARLLEGQPGAALEIDDSLERSWRRVGLALDRSSFTIEERDRGAGLYTLRYVDPKLAGKEEPSLLSRLFGARKEDLSGTRYRLRLSSSGERAHVAVLDEQGRPVADEGARHIAQLLVGELR
ncbi:MAG: outer membrane protein assembly factor BamC [Pseudomonadota bacterium]